MSGLNLYTVGLQLRKSEPTMLGCDIAKTGRKWTVVHRGREMIVFTSQAGARSWARSALKRIRTTPTYSKAKAKIIWLAEI